VAQLVDGRYLAVEYKGEGWVDSADTREKEAIGKLWEARSGGKCLFRLVTIEDMDGVLAGIV